MSPDRGVPTGPGSNPLQATRDELSSGAAKSYIQGSVALIPKLFKSQLYFADVSDMPSNL